MRIIFATNEALYVGDWEWVRVIDGVCRLDIVRGTFLLATMVQSGYW